MFTIMFGRSEALNNNTSTFLRDASPSEIYSSWHLPLASAEITIVYYRVLTDLDSMEKAGRIIVVRENQGKVRELYFHAKSQGKVRELKKCRLP